MQRLLVDWTQASQKDYQSLFGLDANIFSMPILEYRCGPTMLNADLPHVISIDEAFLYSPTDIKVYCKNKHVPEIFFIDYVKGYEEKRYIAWHGAKLNFPDFHFEVALSTYPFFTEENNSENIIKEISELIRVAKVVYLAPHKFDDNQISRTLGPMMLLLQQENVGVAMTPLSPKNKLKKSVMLKLWAQTCQRA